MKSNPPSRPAASADEANPLIFQWERRSWSRLRLVPLLFLSLLAHAASFYVLQVAYTPTASQLPPPAQVVLLALDEPQNAPLARWLAMTDPALMSRQPTPTTSQTLAALNFQYTPSYDTALPDFKPLEPAAANPAAVSTPPRPHPAGPVPAALLPPLPTPAVSGQGTTAGDGQTTRVVFSGEIAALAPAALLPAHFAAAKDALPLDPTVFLVGVRSSGGEPLLFRQPALFQQAASGDAEAEECARLYLARLTFRTPPAPAGGDTETVVWGWATFYWGNDVYKAESRRQKAEGRR